VNVYLHKDSGLNITGSLIRAKDSKDVEAMMVEQGWGFVREEFVNSVLSLKLTELEKKAKEKFKGLHSKEIGVHRPEDLTVPNTQKEDIYYYRRDETLKKLTDNESGVLEGIVDLLTYKVWLQDKNVLLKVKLQGIQGHTIDPLLEEVKQMKEDHKELYDSRLKKRSIQVTIVGYNKETNNFQGTIALQGGKTLQEVLLEESLVYCDREGGVLEKFKAAEKSVREGRKGLWSPALINFEPIDPLELQKEKFRGKFSWVEDGETVCIQPESNYKTLDIIAEKLRSKNLHKVPK
jgi:endonuclease YncB( thermonuclease family)